MPEQVIIETSRLKLRIPEKSDAPYLLKLFNQPDFIHNIRDKNIRSVAAAEAEIETIIRPHFEEHGYCLYAIDYGEAPCIGLAGLIKRPQLSLPDLGYAMRSDYQRMGLTTEACLAVVAYAQNHLALNKVAAIVNPDNMASIRVLNKVGFAFSDGMHLSDDGPLVKYFELTFNQSESLE